MSDPAPMGLIEFPGLNAIRSGSFTLSHGISPSSAIVEISPQSNFACKSGTMAITYGDNVRIEFPDCRLDMASLTAGDSGFTWSMKIRDRRWKWQFGEITGSWNSLRPNRTIDPYYEKTPRELATLCLRAMGETNFNVSQIPNDTRPMVQWDYDNPAEMLQRLCETVDCRVVLRTDNAVWICRNGQGAVLPSTRISSGGYGFDPPEMPDSIKFVFGPTRWQMKINLEAVGIDVDGKVKLIKDLSYNPGGEGEEYGWAKEDPYTFAGLIKYPTNAQITEFNAQLKAAGKQPLSPAGVPVTQKLGAIGSQIRQLALSCVYRMYRISIPATKQYNIPEFGGFADMRLLLPLNDELLTEANANDQTGKEVIDGFPLRQKAQVTGIFYNQIGDPKTEVNTTNGTKYSGSFSIDQERGIVVFSDPVFLRLRVADSTEFPAGIPLSTGSIIVPKGSFSNMPAVLSLECTFNMKDVNTRVPVRHTIEKKLTNNTFRTKAKIVKRDDVILTHRVEHETATIPANWGLTSVATFDQYKAGLDVPLKVFKVITNKAEVEQKARYYIASEQQACAPKESVSYSYPYIIRIELDGAIQQVTWSVGESGATTQAGRNNEFNLQVPSYNERRSVEILRREKLKLSGAPGEVL